MAKKTSTLIVYSYHDEALVMTPESEKEVLTMYFFPNSGRDVQDYDRKEYTNGVLISNGSLRIE